MLDSVNSFLGSPKPQHASNVTQRRRHTNSNSTRCLDEMQEESNVSISFSPVKTCRQNNMSADEDETSSLDNSKISIDLKHHIDTINLDNPLNMKVAMQYLLEKVRDNESLLIAVSKENRNMSNEINELYAMNETLVLENRSLKESIVSIQENQQKNGDVDLSEELKLIQDKTVHFITDFCEWKNDVESNLNDIELMENSLRGEIADLTDQVDVVKSTCQMEKDDVCKSFLMDFQHIESKLDDFEKKLDRCAQPPDGHQFGLEGMNKFQNKLNEIEKTVELNQIVLEVIKEEHSNEIDDLKVSMNKVERDITVTNQYNRRENLIIDGIPDNVPQWKLERTCLEIVHKLGFRDVGVYEVVGCHRLRKKEKDITAPTIIRFTNRKIAEFCKKNKWKLNKFNFNNWNLSMREDLCESNDKIFTECEKLKDRELLSKVFTYNGFVKVSKDRADRPKKLSHMDDVRLLLTDE